MFEFGQPCLQAPAVDAEDRLIFPREGIPEPVLQNAAGPDDVGVLSIVLDDPDELLAHRRGKSTVHQPLRELFRQGEIALRRPLPDPQIP